MGLRLRDINSGWPLFYVYEYLYSVLTCTVTTEYEGSNIPNHSLSQFELHLYLVHQSVMQWYDGFSRPSFPDDTLPRSSRSLDLMFHGLLPNVRSTYHKVANAIYLHQTPYSDIARGQERQEWKRKELVCDIASNRTART